MTDLPVMSPEFDLRVFCYKVLDKNPGEVTEAASVEINHTTKNHRQKTTHTRLRNGSKGRKYCDDLQCLIRMLMNGQMPSDLDQEFIEAVSPLVKNLLKNWRIGNLHEYFTEQNRYGSKTVV